MKVGMPLSANVWLAPALLVVLFLSGCLAPELAFTLPEDYAEGAGGEYPGLVGIPNLDDDNENGEVDWEEAALVEGENDLSSFTLSAALFRGLQRQQRIRMVLEGATSAIRVWRDGEVVLGKVEGGYIEAHSVAPFEDGEEEVLYRVEFEDFLVAGRLRLELHDGDEVLASDEIYVTAAPLILNHHLQQTEEVWLLELDAGPSYNNRQMVSAYEEVLGEVFTAIDGPSYDGDVWVQDEFQFGWTMAPGLRNDIVVDSIRDRSLDEYPEQELLRPDWVVRTWGDSSQVNSLDSFGNLEVSPPVTVDGVNYPFGRIYYGGAEFLHPDRQLTDFLASQRVQRPFEIDTTWLCVSHIDEVSSFVPDPSAPRGFRFVWADTRSAWSLLEGMEPSAPLGRYSLPFPGGHDLPDVAAFLNSQQLRFLNEEIQEDYLDPLLEQMKTELGLSDDEVVLMPALFEEPVGCLGLVAALIPGMANLFVSNRGDQTDVFLADPFMRESLSSAAGQDQDPFIADVTDRMPPHINFHFVDDWSMYHMALGEVHCGSNSTRTPAAHWWETAVHLLPEAP